MLLFFWDGFGFLDIIGRASGAGGFELIGSSGFFLVMEVADFLSFCCFGRDLMVE